ncbi:MAG: hypothetical protein HOO06_00510 [Bdellovibrionaceae bacterium]|nr:hypothetical protein [Pseudobdellovibrionaceae bacterium]
MADKSLNSELILSSKLFFEEAVDSAFKQLKIKTFPLVQTYLVSVLDYYLVMDNLFEKSDKTGRYDQKMLSELYLEAGTLSKEKKLETLKQLGDSSLYMSGFFGDSLSKKIIDLDYYVDMGGAAYGDLSTITRDDIYSRLYKEISYRFVEFMDAFSLISQNSMIQSNKDLLKLYDKYLSTGSELAKEQLAKEGILNAQSKQKIKKQ